MDYVCDYRGKEVLPEVYTCQVHGQCTLQVSNSRIRACENCRDRYHNEASHQLQPPKLLGDKVQEALAVVGVTADKVTAWLGVDCNCDERRLKLNQVHVWAKRVVSGKLEKAREYLDEILTQ